MKTPRTTSCSEEVVDNIHHCHYFCDDLLGEILSRLPIKSLFRFKCVSRSWRSLISSYEFQTQQRLRNSLGCFYRFQPHGSPAQEPNYLCTPVPDEEPGDDSIRVIDLRFLPNYPNFQTIDSCHGLVLCLNDETDPVTYFVCNPLTKRWVILPNLEKQWGRDCTAKFAFDPSVSPDFQAILVWCPSDIIVNIFSSATGKWVQSTMPWQAEVTDLYPPGASMNGNIYDVGFPSHVLSIDLKEMNFQVLELPEELYNGLVGRLGNFLCYTSNDGYVLKIWVLKDSSRNEWELKDAVVLEDLEKKLLQPICSKAWCEELLCRCQHPFNPLGFHPIVESVFLWAHCRIFRYDLMNSRLVEIWRHDNCGELGLSFEYSFTEYSPSPIGLERIPSWGQSALLLL
ncbi:F-box protein At1g11270-like [Aristolochia californica]|uniref:F-box protein At1g11270-like n=1 Tax=Aristolochia californica TaxID=171875 RepID=UPI0035D556E0